MSSIDEELEILVNEGYLTYSPNPFVGYFTVYNPSYHDYGDMGLSVFESRACETQEDLENGYILYYT